MSDLERLRTVRVADVYKAGRPAATLERTERGDIRFAYRDGYLADLTARAVATTLPLADEPVTTTAGSLPAFFAGLLPEGHRLSVLRRAVKTSADDELTLLLAVGADAPGDVQVLPAGESVGEAAALVGFDEAPTTVFRELVDEVDTHAIPGVQAKASASMISAPVSAKNGRFILKLGVPEYPRLVENEHAHLTAAKGLRVPVADAQIATDRTGETGLLVRRFDRFRAGAVWGRLAFEDGTQVLGLPPASKYQIPAEDVALALASLTTAPVVAARNLYLQFVFAWLVGNGDLHAKNLAVLEAEPGRWTIAPVYDVVCTLLYGDASMALPIDGRTTSLKRRHWDAFARRLGIPDRAATSANALALRAAASVDLDAVGMTGSPVRGAVRELGFRRAELG
ncbi:type II toxin-antitoxin system HipA family toxin [Agromyces sp. LHK192]|uniref:type II toxin-antitoxin system HipA family toxin n=1 Tax=Agromyces sp. LHK192 TaxID=2498704 RepID=UPI000FD878CE|nr:HipA domain-containing protein [Agromyces sp. LHK192]